MEAVSKY
jgi:fatty-acyl-CoA synthase